MKPLRLAATAFGPFGASIDIDFDRLAGLGLFVVSGDTGAGKTSVFDAMFYALYGELPGDRHRHHHIRSDHATPDCECEVTFEFLAGGDIWQIVRKPSQPAPRSAVGVSPRSARPQHCPVETAMCGSRSAPESSTSTSRSDPSSG